MLAASSGLAWLSGLESGRRLFRALLIINTEIAVSDYVGPPNHDLTVKWQSPAPDPATPRQAAATSAAVSLYARVHEDIGFRV
jgi:hypothetical protein